ncbi:hypothetical protein [Paenibacillus herberti]|uniref:Uncharacterized protein n=1 Tax=Paenibacillus herberti TaxID=1619309 RepID=A0A229NXB3_9BACL|nr:hypothetical protein [Paenibacillus herberti]OXM14457.1 hypothetical protein CGZ75_16065 [Paenibacillus herberti]
MIFDRDDFLSSIETYKHQFRNFIEQEKKNLSFLQNRFEQMGIVNSLSKLTTTDYFEFEGDETVAKNEIIHSLHSGLMITTCGRFEYHLILVCEVVQRALEIGVSHKDVHGSGIRNVANYFDALFKLKLSKSSEYKRVIEWLEVRNLLTHHYGTAETDKQFEKIFAVDMSFDHDSNMIFVSMNDCHRLLKDFEIFSLFLFAQLESVADESEEL